MIDRATDILGLVDVQPTFMPGGELAVADGDAVVPVINRVTRHFDHAFATQDWHPPGHSSFASAHPGHKPYDTIAMPYGQQVLWPDHAIQGSPNAALHRDADLTRVEVIIRKGFDRDIDSYSTFFENDRRTATGLDGWLRQRGFRRIYLVGIGDRFLRRLVGGGRGASRLRGGGHRGRLPRHRRATRQRPHHDGRGARTAGAAWRAVRRQRRARRMTTWLVTGGAGFIGSHLCEALLARGDAVRVLDDLSTGRRENLPPDVALIEGDVADPAAVRDALRGVGGCFHLAAIASVERGVTDWLGTHRANLTGTITVFDARAADPDPGGLCVLRRGVRRCRHRPDHRGDRMPAALRLWRRQARLRTACPRRRPCARHPDRRAALLQCVWTTPGPALALFRRDLDLLRAHSPRRADRHSSATAGRRATSSMSPMSSRRCWRRCGSRRQTRPCSTCAPASRPRCWTWRGPSPNAPARGSTRATDHRARARSGTRPARPPCRARSSDCPSR